MVASGYKEGSNEMLEVLLKHGAQLNCANSRLNNPIHTAASLNKVDFIRFFKEKEEVTLCFTYNKINEIPF